MAVADKIRSKLSAALAPVTLEIKDESDLHSGHSGWREGGETHFKVDIVSAAFEGMARVQRHRHVYEILSDELDGPVHALSLTTHTPGEFNNKS
jgi:BolA protein